MQEYLAKNLLRWVRRYLHDSRSLRRSLRAIG